MTNNIPATLSEGMEADCLNLSKRDLSSCLSDLIQVVAGDNCPSKLDLTACQFGSAKDFCHFVTTLAQTNMSITHLILATNHSSSDSTLAFDGACLKTLLEHHKSLRILDLTGVALSEEAVADLIQGLQHNTTLRELILPSCSLNEESACLVMQNATHLEALDLGSNQSLSPEFLNTFTADRLSDKNCRLKSLVLNHSSSIFAVQEASELAPFFQALKTNKTLQNLSLRCCSLKENIGKALLETLTINDTLLSLDVEFSGFGLRDKGNEILIDLLPKFKALQNLKMLCRFPPNMVEPLLAAAESNTTLRTFRPVLPQKQQLNEFLSCLSRNISLAQVVTLVQPKIHVPAALLPNAVGKFSTAGSSASFQVLQYWIAECL